MHIGKVWWQFETSKWSLEKTSLCKKIATKSFLQIKTSMKRYSSSNFNNRTRKQQLLQGHPNPVKLAKKMKLNKPQKQYHLKQSKHQRINQISNLQNVLKREKKKPCFPQKPFCIIEILKQKEITKVPKVSFFSQPPNV